jgi:hypothetical protein
MIDGGNRYILCYLCHSNSVTLQYVRDHTVKNSSVKDKSSKCME